MKDKRLHQHKVRKNRSGQPLQKLMSQRVFDNLGTYDIQGATGVAEILPNGGWFEVVDDSSLSTASKKAIEQAVEGEAKKEAPKPRRSRRKKTA